MQRRCLMLLLSFAVLSVGASALAQQLSKLPLQTYVADRCGVRFDYPAGWHVIAMKNCKFRIDRDPQKDRQAEDDRLQTDPCAISISVVEASWENAAQKAGFKRRDGQWIFQGETEAPANPIQGSPYKGLLVDDFPCRIFDENGYVGMGDCAAALVANGGRAASFYAHPESLELLPRIARSFRFQARGSEPKARPAEKR